MSDMAKIDAVREAFEIFALGAGCDIQKTDCNSPIYFSQYVQGCWLAWQACASLPVDGVVVRRELLRRVCSMVPEKSKAARKELRALLASREQQEGE